MSKNYETLLWLTAEEAHKKIVNGPSETEDVAFEEYTDLGNPVLLIHKSVKSITSELSITEKFNLLAEIAEENPDLETPDEFVYSDCLDSTNLTSIADFVLGNIVVSSIQERDNDPVLAKRVS